MTRAGLWDAICTSASVTAVLFMIIIGGVFFSRLLTATGFIGDFLVGMKALALPPRAVVAFVGAAVTAAPPMSFAAKGGIIGRIT